MCAFYLPILLQKYATNPLNKDLNLNGFRAVNSIDPVLNSDLATKNYVDITAGGGGASTGALPFSLVAGATVIGQFTNPTGNDLQLTAPTSTGKLIFSDIHGIDFTNSPATFTNNTGNVITVSPSGTTKGIRINGNNDPNAPLLEIASSGGERHFTSSRSGAVNQSQVYIRDTTTGGLTMVELSKENNGTGLSMTKTAGTTGDAILVTNNGTGYALSTAGTKGDVQIAGTLDQNGRIVQTSGGGSDTFLLTHPSGVGDGLHIVKNGTTGHGLNIENNGTGLAMSATITTATGGVLITKNTNSGAGIPLEINHQSNFTSGQSSVVVSHNSNAVGVNITGNGATGTMLLTQNGAGYGLTVNKASGSGNGVIITNAGSGNSLDIGRTNTTVAGDGINVLVDGTQTATRAIRANINTGAATTCEFRHNGSGNAVFIQTTANAGTCLEALHQANNSSNAVVIRKEGAGAGAALDIRNLSTGDSLRVADETATDNTMFRIDADGNVGIGVASAVALTNKFESNASSGNNSTFIGQGTASIELRATNTTDGTSGVVLDTTSTQLIGRSDILLEPSRGLGAAASARLRMTTTNDNGVIIQTYRGQTPNANARLAFCRNASTASTMNLYTGEGTTDVKKIKMGNCDYSDAAPNSVVEISRDATIHGTSIPHILLSGTNATGGVVMNANAGRIESVADPVNAQDVATRAWVLANAGTPTSFTLANTNSGNANGFRIYNLPNPTLVYPGFGEALVSNPTAYTSSGGSRTTQSEFFRSISYPRMLSVYYNTQTTAYSNSATNNNLNSITNFLFNNSALGMENFYSFLGGFSNAPVTLHTRITSGNGRAGTFLLNSPGTYKFTLQVNIGTAASPPGATVGIPIQMIQGTVSTLSLSFPIFWFKNTEVNTTYSGQNTRVSTLQCEFYANSGNGTYVSFGAQSSYNITADNFISAGNANIAIEYLGRAI